MALFTGTHDRKIDGKGRLVIPASIAGVVQAESQGRMFLVPAGSGLPCLEAYPATRFSDMAKAHAPDRFEGDQLARRRFFQRAREVEIKGPGRITIPSKKWMEKYFPDGVVRVAGMADYLELWDPKAWDRLVGDDDDDDFDGPKNQAGFGA